jgi:hypothetical protein
MSNIYKAQLLLVKKDCQKGGVDFPVMGVDDFAGEM